MHFQLSEEIWPDNFALLSTQWEILLPDAQCYARSSINCCLLCCFVQNGSSNGELLIKNAQLKHAGRYTCTAQTPIDNVTASAHLVVRGESWVVQLQYTYAYSCVYEMSSRFWKLIWCWWRKISISRGVMGSYMKTILRFWHFTWAIFMFCVLYVLFSLIWSGRDSAGKCDVTCFGAPIRIK